MNKIISSLSNFTSVCKVILALSLIYFLTGPSLATTDDDHLNAYVAALRTTPGALPTMLSLTGQIIPTSGFLDLEQIGALFNELYDPLTPGLPKGLAYDNPTQAALNWTHVGNYVQSLRQTPGALTALQQLTGQIVPEKGTFPYVYEINNLKQQFFTADGNPTIAYTTPDKAAQSLPHVLAYLQSLRQTPGALTAFNSSKGQTLPATGTITTNQLQFMFTQMFNADGSPTLAYTNPKKAAEALVPASTTHSKSDSNTAELALGIGLLVALGAAVFFYGLPADLFPLLGMGALAVLALFLIINSQKKEDQALGEGDAPDAAFTSNSSSDPLVQTTPTQPTMTQVSPVDSSMRVTIQPPLHPVSPEVTGDASRGNTQYVIGNDKPNGAYKSFYLADHQSPTGLSVNPNTASAVTQQNSDLAMAGNPTSESASAKRAASANKNVTLTPQN